MILLGPEKFDMPLYTDTSIIKAHKYKYNNTIQYNLNTSKTIVRYIATCNSTMLVGKQAGVVIRIGTISHAKQPCMSTHGGVGIICVCNLLDCIKISIPSITVNGVIVPVLNEPVGNLGPVFDPNMNMSAHVSKFIKSGNYHLRNIGKIRKFLNTDTTKSAIVSLVTSRLDYCNGLLCGINDELQCRLQKVQNNAARVVNGSKKYDHITPFKRSSLAAHQEKD